MVVRCAAAVSIILLVLVLSVLGQNDTTISPGDSAGPLSSSPAASSIPSADSTPGTDATSTAVNTTSDSSITSTPSGPLLTRSEDAISSTSSSVASNDSTTSISITDTSSSEAEIASTPSPTHTLVLSLTNPSIDYCSDINITVNDTQTSIIQWSVTPPIPSFTAESNRTHLILPSSHIVPGNFTFTATDDLNNTGSIEVNIPPMQGSIFYKDQPDTAKTVSWSDVMLRVSFSTCRHNVSLPSWSAVDVHATPVSLHQVQNRFAVIFPQYSTPGVYHVMADITYQNEYVQRLSFRLEVVPTAPYAAISQNSIVLLGHDEAIFLDAYPSLNLDTQDSNGLTYLWTCTSSQGDCNTSTHKVSNTSSTLSITAGSLPVGLYRFQLTVSTAYLSSSAFTSLTIGDIIDPMAVTVFTAHLDYTPSEAPSVSWSSDTLSIRNYGKKLASGSFYIPSYILTSCTNYSLSCNVTSADAHGYNVFEFSTGCPVTGGKMNLKVVERDGDVFVTNGSKKEVDTLFSVSFSNYSTPEVPVYVDYYLQAADGTHLYLNDDPYQILTTLYPTKTTDRSMTIVAKVYRADNFAQQTYILKVNLGTIPINASEYHDKLFLAFNSTDRIIPIVSPLAAYSVQNDYAYGIRYVVLSQSTVPLAGQKVTDDDYTVFNYVIQPDARNLSKKFVTGSLYNLVQHTETKSPISLFYSVIRSASIALYGWNSNATDIWDENSPYESAAENLYVTLTTLLPQKIDLSGLCGAGAFSQRMDNIEFYAVALPDYTWANLESRTGAGVQFPEEATTQSCQAVNFVYWPFDIFTQSVPSTLIQSNYTGVITISNMLAPSGQFELTFRPDYVDFDLNHVYCASREIDQDWTPLDYATFDQGYFVCLVDPPRGNHTDYTLFLATPHQIILRDIQSLIDDGKNITSRFDELMGNIKNLTGVDPLRYCSPLAAITVIHPATTVSYLSLCNSSFLQSVHPISNSIAQILAGEYIHPRNDRVFDFISTLTSRIVHSDVQTNLSTQYFSLIISRQLSQESNQNGYTLPDDLSTRLGQPITVALSYLSFNPLSIEKKLDFVSNITGLSVHSSNGTELDVRGSRQPISIRISQLGPNIKSEDSLSCVYWNESIENFDKGGCRTSIIRREDGSVAITCTCDHLTNFTVIRNPRSVDATREYNVDASVHPAAIAVPIVLGTLLMIVLIAIIVVFIKRRKNDRRQFVDLEMTVNESDY
ncbi:hypothetical protein PROFUN_10720 [Planoprotostelium fungivorum]|uniref:Uncharacterized protein n=1 Tax=Planoprotostelium fungivorum TaxID=1890364 RepID=A0A2P6N9P3_9EUKA|nr:hypothetical protein PROFUN_10720 [Planoprotostelium fungivorum]